MSDEYPEPTDDDLRTMLENGVEEIIEIFDDFGEEYEQAFGNADLVPTLILKVLGQLVGQYISSFTEDARDEAMTFLQGQAKLVLDNATHIESVGDAHGLADMPTKGNA